MIKFTFLLNQFVNKVNWKEFQEIIQSFSLKKINFEIRKNNSIFINGFNDNIAESLKLLFGKRGIILDFYNLTDYSELIDFLNNKMKYKSTIDQTSRDNIFITPS